MRNKRQPRFGLVAGILAGILILAGCSNVLQEPSVSQGSTGEGRVTITIDGGARTVLPPAEVFSRFEVTIAQQGGTKELEPVEATGGSAELVLPIGAWDVQVWAYNQAEPVALVAQAGNTLTNTGGEVTGNTRFVLEPTGTGPGVLAYRITKPEGSVLDGDQSRVQIEQNGIAVKTIGISGSVEGETNLEPGRYIVDIRLDEATGDKVASQRETVVILPGLTTAVAFAPEALVEPVDMLSYTFSSLGEYRAVVAALPENTAESPYEISLTGIAFEDLWEGYDPLGQIFSVQGGRYLALDLSGCTGTAIGSLDDPAHIYWDGSLARSIGGNQDKGSIQSNSRERERVVSLVLPESLECIGDFTFAWFRYLKSVALPESLKVIGHGAFKYAGFTSVEIPDSVERIGIHAFGGGGTSKNLKSVKLPSSLKEIGAWAFSEQPLSSIELPHGLEVIGEHAFASLNSELRSISIPDTVTTIGMQAFWCTKQLESITLPASLTSLGSNVFSFSGIKSADFSACVNLENLYGYLFNECLSLTEVKVPPNVKYLYGEVFIDSNLRFLDLPASVEEVSYDTFGRSNIGTLILRSVTPPTIRPIIYTPYEGESKLLTHPPIILPMQVIYVPDESVQAYREADEWSESAAKFRGLSEYPG